MLETHLINNYKRMDIAFEQGSNYTLTDTSGKSYIDLLAGIAVVNVGHSNPHVIRSVQEQLPRLVHTSNIFRIPLQEALATRITELSFPCKGFFCNSGAEANEAAVKLARLYSFNKRGADNFKIITLLRSFHGRTMAGISATGQEKVKLGFNPLLNGFEHVEPNDMEAMAKAARGAAAILVELVQGESGVHPLDRGYVRELRQFCSDNDILLMLDEVQTGIGRTGKMFAFQNYDIEPDVFTIAKGLGNGFPIGAMFAKEPFASHMVPGTHGSTFGGNPLCCSAAMGVLDAFETDGILEHVQHMEAHLRELCEAMLGRGTIMSYRGLGLMYALELPGEMPDLVKACLQNGLIINQTSPSTIRLLPPLTIDRQGLSQGLEILENTIRNLT
ncbi:aspartate aminotransferase family protein [Desulfurispirillum indicum]|uniref:Acetylornithine aminotransferase n=1 Tax=Desulfurispirillum indicum (strain ATCC BAA-1389 / DSM 22839 / S5) TaxID=653733 RepID=E6W200_DESIS|nr:aspartate aminotransferase family protein [Desulfurispirillum indicum]ADU66626.1 acetylornithine and succinylornithine aminotransferase [Desulfurispirillum indicum S5]UCZ55943.1 aspartate aminotransferase family protein [Desulfurispirillum indicum]